MEKDEDAHIMHLTPEESLRFAEMLLNPPEPNEALKALFEKYSPMLTEE